MAMVNLRNLVTNEIYNLTALRDDYNADNVTHALAKHLDVKTHSLLLLDMVTRSAVTWRSPSTRICLFRAHIKGNISLMHLSWTST